MGFGVSGAVIPLTARRLLGASPGAAGARDRSADPSVRDFPKRLGLGYRPIFMQRL